MQPYDDEQFHSYLKSFKPLASDPLPATTSARRKPYSIPRFAAAAALIAFTVLAGFRDWRSVEIQKRPAAVIRTDGPAQPLTLARVNALLAQPQSFKASLDEIAITSTHLQLSQGQLSALKVLGKENKL